MADSPADPCSAQSFLSAPTIPPQPSTKFGVIKPAHLGQCPVIKESGITHGKASYKLRRAQQRAIGGARRLTRRKGGEEEGEMEVVVVVVVVV